MVDTRRHLAHLLLVAAVLVAVPVGGFSAGPGPQTPPPPPTVEPTPALVIEMRFEDVERGAAGRHGRLIVDLRAEEPLSDLSLETILKDGLAIVGPDVMPRGPLGLRKGETRRFVLDVAAAGTAGSGARIEAAFRDSRGRLFRIGQGASLPAATADAGRSHAGAWEVMGEIRAEAPR
jgi:hypothetical protein